MREETVYVVGHKNPDTDSICSAIAYARLRQQQGMANIAAARAGNINRQTEFVLEELALPRPQLLVDVYPRVKDVVGEHVVTIAAGAPLARALELFHLHNVRLLPVIDAERRPLGLLFLKRLSEHFLVPNHESELRRVLASPSSIRQCLRGRFLREENSESVEEFNLYVGAMASATFQKKMAGLDPRKMILITGDRENIHQEAVAMGVRILIVTGSLPVSEEIVAAGRDKGVTIISTSFDTATSAWLTRLSTPVECLMSREFQTVSLQDRLDELRLKLLHTND
ncbi:MAG TPA: DRTGG domain-containing protein, partial [Desulfuromonadales bacterium]|nr:DRTGG domain-containing protein [Desulfuromonadales bacterium]